MSSEVSREIEVFRDLLTLAQHIALPNRPAVIVTGRHMV